MKIAHFKLTKSVSLTQTNTKKMQIKNYINGELISPIDKQYLDVFNPASGEIYAQAPD